MDALRMENHDVYNDHCGGVDGVTLGAGHRRGVDAVESRFVIPDI